MLSQQTKLHNFRQKLIGCFKKRSDAIFNLLDAITSYAHHCHSVVQLSESQAFERQYTSITDAVADGLVEADWEEARKVVFEQAITDKEETQHFLLDCTPNPRPYANKLQDRTITHLPNPAPGNRPICVGHQYSLVALSPNAQEQRKKHWVVPMSMQRVESENKGNEFGMKQLNETINQLNLQSQLSISVGDSLYGTEVCRRSALEQPNLVHIFRLANNRNIFSIPDEKDHSATKRGRKKCFGDKMKLSDTATHPEVNQQTTHSYTDRKGRLRHVTIKQWNNMLMRGSRQFDSHQHPINLIQVVISDAHNEPVFKRPLWLAVFGNRRHEVSIDEAYESYSRRYDIEHCFRFSKQNLLLDSYQTPDVSHEESWWQLVILSYAQLYLANTLASLLPKPWEKHLPEYQEPSDQQVKTPSQTQRAFSNILESVGTPANPCVPRGQTAGRLKDTALVKREGQPVVFKSKKIALPQDQAIDSPSESSAEESEAKLIGKLLSQVKSGLKKLQITPKQFAEKLIDST